MAYRCQYRIDREVLCQNWTREDEDYCETHRPSIEAVENMWRAIVAAIAKAREKKA